MRKSCRNYLVSYFLTNSYSLMNLAAGRALQKAHGSPQTEDGHGGVNLGPLVGAFFADIKDGVWLPGYTWSPTGER